LSRSPDGTAQPWLAGGPGHWTLSVWAQPGARNTVPQGILDGCLKLRLAAPPVEGKANDALLRWIAGRLAIPLRAVELAAGHASRRKRVTLRCELSGELIAQRLLSPR